MPISNYNHRTTDKLYHKLSVNNELISYPCDYLTIAIIPF